ncbi:uroporphyrinogen-III C-methyltransferase [Natrialbaceae archaeon AArc-T1-2]|uniref:uroporphyrinogen-III C-methyltransferase n=1 Tax=Natrialbaceae archaeon AArc-T1-2 TaxID=3053904 RepID=UPI00255A8CAC|nr:uroporphyrinogen-III C-methyltransferase [Natrialbaceae archaeon AArc-T1-2]WIV66479.1 uroporphyrinogen-III C-methyltransferase [Natrialbaceae archaeon AArc-T1-2]
MEDDTARGSGRADEPQPPSSDDDERAETTNERESAIVRATADAVVRTGDGTGVDDSGSSLPNRCHASPGTVYLIGAGPGDPDLLTVRARLLVETADVILHDALVRKAMLETLPASAEIVDVGKRVEYKTPQEEINDLLVSHARDGDAVVRLKGGDPFVFGRGGEEAQHLTDHEVPFQIVPGVSSVLAAPGVAGIPLTHRDVSSRFTVITGHETPDKDESALDWDAISAAVESGGTLVVLMGVRTLERNVTALRDHGVDPDKPVALVQKATWDDQHVVRGTLETIVDRAEAESVSPPATAVIGDVTAIRDEIEPALEPFDPA